MENEARYYSFGRYLRQRFGCLVHKVTIDAGFTCPNRDGTRGRGGCTFCNNVGFSPAASLADASDVHQQIATGIAVSRTRRKAEKFLAYYQAYSNTYADVARLRSLYDAAFEFPEVVGISIGTRPDCVDQAKIDLLAEYTARGEVWLEYGLQSVHDETLQRINRLHNYQEFLDAMAMTRDRGIKICVHTIIGLPGESRDMMMETYDRLAEMNFDGIKIHLLHLMKNTLMAVQYERGEITLLERDEYVGLVCDALERLPANVVVQRMHADAPADVLVAPAWALDKAGILIQIRNELVRRDTWQGKRLGYTINDIPQPDAGKVGR